MTDLVISETITESNRGLVVLISDLAHLNWWVRVLGKSMMVAARASHRNSLQQTAPVHQKTSSMTSRRY